MLSRRSVLVCASLVLSFTPVSRAPMAAAQSQPASRPSFDVVSIKPVEFAGSITMQPLPNGLHAEAVTARMLIRNGCRVQEFLIEGGPGWVTQDRFTVEAKGMVGPGQLPLMMQSMLEDRFKLK